MSLSRDLPERQVRVLVRCPSDYDGWDVIDPGTECPDCGWVPDSPPPSNLGLLLDLISGHMAECEGADLS